MHRFEYMPPHFTSSLSKWHEQLEKGVQFQNTRNSIYIVQQGHVILDFRIFYTMRQFSQMKQGRDIDDIQNKRSSSNKRTESNIN